MNARALLVRIQIEVLKRKLFGIYRLDPELESIVENIVRGKARSK